MFVMSHIAAAAKIRTQKGFRIDDTVKGTFRQHRAGQLVEFLGAGQHLAGLIVDVQKMAKVAKHVAAVRVENAVQPQPFLCR